MTDATDATSPHSSHQGHAMTAIEVLHDLQGRDIRLTVDGDQLRYDAPADVMTDEVLQLLRQHKAALLTLLQLPLDAPPLPAADDHEERLSLTSPASIPGACFACGGMRRWRSRYGAVVCARCHPPPDMAAVVAWLDGHTAIKGDAHDPR